LTWRGYQAERVGDCIGPSDNLGNNCWPFQSMIVCACVFEPAKMKQARVQI
jgi:hypothetical protein